MINKGCWLNGGLNNKQKGKMWAKWQLATIGDGRVLSDVWPNLYQTVSSVGVENENVNFDNPREGNRSFAPKIQRIPIGGCMRYTVHQHSGISLVEPRGSQGGT